MWKLCSQRATSSDDAEKARSNRRNVSRRHNSFGRGDGNKNEVLVRMTSDTRPAWLSVEGATLVLAHLGKLTVK